MHKKRGRPETFGMALSLVCMLAV